MRQIERRTQKYRYEKRERESRGKGVYRCQRRLVHVGPPPRPSLSDPYTQEARQPWEDILRAGRSLLLGLHSTMLKCAEDFGDALTRLSNILALRTFSALALKTSKTTTPWRGECRVRTDILPSINCS